MNRNRRNRTIVLVLVAVMLISVAVGIGMLGSIGMLPWQPEPTRIPVAPFEGLGGGGVEATPIP